jgi:hypothetical protein
MGISRAGYLKRAVKFRGEVCSLCGSVEGISIHHKDRDVSNNDPSNLDTLCVTCHMKGHWASGTRPTIERKKCRICGLPAKGYELCSKHYFRQRRHGDPTYQKGSHHQAASGL